MRRWRGVSERFAGCIRGRSLGPFGTGITDSRSGLIIGDFHERFGPRRKTGDAETDERGILRVSRRRGARKTNRRGGGHDLVNRKNS